MDTTTRILILEDDVASDAELAIYRVRAVDSILLLRSIADRLREHIGAIGGYRLDIDVTEQAVPNDADRARTEWVVGRLT